MKKSTKIMMITASALTLLGAAISGFAILNGAASHIDVRTHSQSVKAEGLDSININVAADCIIVTPSASENINISYTSHKTKQYTLKTENNSLFFESVPKRNLNLQWYDYIGLNWGVKDNKILLEVPENFQAEVNLKTKYGDISVSNINGKIYAKASYGDIEIDRASDNIQAECDFGDIEIRNVSAPSIDLSNKCGDIEIKNSSGDIQAECDLGDIEFENISAQNIKFKNHCGDIEGTINGSQNDYTVNTETHSGKNSLQRSAGGKYSLWAECDLGDIEISFLK